MGRLGDGMPKVIRAVQKGKYNIMLLIGTKIHNGMYCQNRLGYGVSRLAATAKEGSRGKGAAEIVFRECLKGWMITSTRFHGSNVVSCELVMDNIWMPVIVAYLPHSMIEHLPDLDESLNCYPDGDPIILGDLNAYID